MVLSTSVSFAQKGGLGPSRRLPTSSSSSSIQHSQLPPEVQAANSPTPPASFGALTDQTFYWLPRNRAGRSGHRSPAEFVLTWQVLRRAVLLALVLGGVLGCYGGMLRVGCQEVVLSADSDGCLASKAPGPPTKLKVFLVIMHS